MSVLVYDCGSVENTVTAILDTESGAMIIRGNGDIDNYADESSPWYSEHSDILQVTVDKGITRIGSGTFYGCENLSFVEIASTVTSIGADVFQNCTSLTSIKIPKSITDIGDGTFVDSGLTEVKFYGNPPTVGTDIFDGVTADVYTPEGNEEWTETAKGTVAGNGSNLTWKEFDSKPNLIEYDELDYFWSKIKKYVDNNVSVTQVVSSGTKIATITVNGVDTDLYSSPFSGTIGDSTTPIYIDNGVPTACGGSLAVDITGNAATATSATSATSATTATNSNNSKLTHTVGNTEYPLVFGSSFVITDAQQELRIGTPTATAANCALRAKAYCAAANTQGEAYLVIGNNLAKASANNSRGGIYLYGTGTTWAKFQAGDQTANKTVTLVAPADVTLTLPSATGTIALTSSSITGNSANVTGTVAIANGGTGATTRLNALKALTNENVGTNATYFLTITDSWGKGGYSSVANVKSVLGIPASGTIATTASNITGSSASCTGNAASSTYATNIRVTDTDSNTWYPLVFSSGSAASTNYVARVDSDSILVYPGTSPAANTQGNCYLQLGNAKAKATAGNKRGVLRIYGTGTSYTEITSAVASTARSISFPDKAGTVALTSDIPTGITSATSKTTTTYRCDELKFGSGLLLKFIYPKNNSVSLTPSADETVTFETAFTTIAAVFRFAFSVSGQLYTMSSSSTNTKRPFGYFANTMQSGYGSAGEDGKLTLTSYKVIKDNPTPLIIIAGY